MMKLCLVFLILFNVYMCLPAGKDEEKYCRYLGLWIKKGQTSAVPGKCFQVTCEEVRDSSYTPVMSVRGCPKLNLTSNCYASEYKYRKPFPECCPQRICN